MDSRGSPVELLLLSNFLSVPARSVFLPKTPAGLSFLPRWSSSAVLETAQPLRRANEQHRELSPPIRIMPIQLESLAPFNSDIFY